MRMVGPLPTPAVSSIEHWPDIEKQSDQVSIFSPFLKPQLTPFPMYCFFLQYSHDTILLNTLSISFSSPWLLFLLLLILVYFQERKLGYNTYNMQQRCLAIITPLGSSRLGLIFYNFRSFIAHVFPSLVYSWNVRNLNICKVLRVFTEFPEHYCLSASSVKLHMIIPIFQMRKLRLREVKPFAQEHTGVESGF